MIRDAGGAEHYARLGFGQPALEGGREVTIVRTDCGAAQVLAAAAGRSGPELSR